MPTEIPITHTPRPRQDVLVSDESPPPAIPPHRVTPRWLARILLGFELSGFALTISLIIGTALARQGWAVPLISALQEVK